MSELTQRQTRIRVFSPPIEPKPDAYWDFDAPGTRIDISPDGSMLLTRIRPTGETRLNPSTGKLEDGLEVKILAVIGPNGRLRATTVEPDD